MYQNRQNKYHNNKKRKAKFNIELLNQDKHLNKTKKNQS